MSNKRILSYFETIVMVVLVFAFVYSFSSMSLVSAQNEISNCCQLDKEGKVCMDYPSLICDDLCSENCLPTNCEVSTVCEQGCCIEEETGLCSPNSPKEKCEKSGGKWTEEDLCNVAECEKGCCLLGDMTEYATENRCKILSVFNNKEFDFRQVSYEQCLESRNTKERGACIVREGENVKCQFLEKADCVRLKGDFHLNLLCSNSDLDTNCEKTSNTICAEGRDEVYFVDTCGNIANIYDENKKNNDEYWSRVFTKNESCSIPGELCGNCNYPDNKCFENSYCRDVSCKDAPYLVNAEGNVLEKRDRKNGESWCVYDGVIGQGRDVVGSRHFKYYCLDGEVKIEACQDFRQEICVEGKENTVNKAECRINMWRNCLGYNQLIEAMGDSFDYSKMSEECNKNIDCYVKRINIDEGFKFQMCMPQYPTGFDLNDEARLELAKTTCNAGNSDCPVIYVKTITGWECKLNCDCESSSFTQQMNDFCIGLGDCGGYVNIVGDTSDSYTVQGAPRIQTNQYIKNINAEEGQIAETGNLSAYDNRNLAQTAGVSLVGTAEGASEIEYLVFSELTRWILNFGGLFPVAGEMYYYMQTAIYKIPILGDIIKFLLEDFVGGILKMIFGWGETKEKHVKFSCEPWQAPSGGENCKKCNSELKPCSEYRCSSLGQGCELINQGSKEEICAWKNLNDKTPPELSPWRDIISEGYKYLENENGFELKQENNDCIEVYKKIDFGVELTESARCKIDTTNKDYEDMERFFGDDNLFRNKHKMSINVPHPDSISGTNDGYSYDYLLSKLGNVKFFAKCEDINGNVNIEPYLIDICVKPGADLTAPEIVNTEPENPGFVKYGLNKQEVKIYTNEPADCKFSSENKEYIQMENSMTCFNKIEHVTQLGWKCTNTLNLAGENNKFYFRCNDQPWLKNTINETQRNTNQESYIYELKKSLNELKIDEIYPEGQITSGSLPATLTLTVKTSGGAENGKSICSYYWINNWIEFFKTNSSTHSQPDLNLDMGRYRLPIKCEDKGKNIAEGETEFRIVIDKAAPEVIRAYKDGANLKIITDEDSECSYTFNTCNFIFENGKEMSGLLKEHTSSWIQGTVYYIKCEDIWGRKPSGCSIIIKAA